ncbi:DUF3500 domain-containing protein [Mangrovicoccus sp. HB161399]|uniref:DUF3500 domain-containing protein n=1 Tax=Mangrovicoccus sp. HB161399 TaxID=2720392 RepID=UPI001556C88F|nr:DUF3500 domain-containing protein [Mangrovicoccus sp. HB161399]
MAKSFCLGLAACIVLAGPAASQSANPAAIIPLKPQFGVPEADGQSRAIVAAAQAFLATLPPAGRSAAVFPLSDDDQRANWSNLPDGAIARRGIRRGDMDRSQLAALDRLLASVLSDRGMRNIRWQLAAEDSLGGRRFSSDLYYVSFLGEPSETAPWMLQFGGHHLALNVTVFGPEVTFSPMLTGGQPLHLRIDGDQVFITAEETGAAQTLLDSLDPQQRKAAIRSGRVAPLLLGPGAFGTRVAPEGVKGSTMTPAQRELLVAVIEARLGFMNEDDFAEAMAEVRAGLDKTWFGWWGPQGRLGTAYFRITGPRLVMEYAPQRLGGDYADHAHSMYRDPQNDYGTAWIEAD